MIQDETDGAFNESNKPQSHIFIRSGQTREDLFMMYRYNEFWYCPWGLLPGCVQKTFRTRIPGGIFISYLNHHIRVLLMLRSCCSVYTELPMDILKAEPGHLREELDRQTSKMRGLPFGSALSSPGQTGATPSLLQLRHSSVIPSTAPLLIQRLFLQPVYLFLLILVIRKMFLLSLYLSSCHLPDYLRENDAAFGEK